MVGDDKKSYLHGQVTCDVVSLKPHQATLGAHCDAKGKMWSIFRLFHHLDGYALVQRASGIDTALSEIKKYAVFSKVEITQSEDALLGVMGEQAEAWLSQFVDTSQEVAAFSAGTAVKVAKQRWLLLVNAEHVDALLANSEAEICDDSLWDWADIDAAIPRIDSQDQASNIPQALNLQALDGISFSKGCYTGQETIARAKYRGMNKRALFKVSGPTLAPLSDTTTLERAVGDNWRSAGTLIAQYQYSDQQACGLIVLPKETEADTKLRLSEQPDALWHVEPLPYSLDDE